MKQNHIAIEVSQEEHFRSPFLMKLKEDWPSLAKDFRHYCHVCRPQQGDVWVWSSPQGQKFVHFIIGDANHNLLSSDERIHYFKHCLKHLMKIVTVEGIEEIDLPKGSFQFNEDELKTAEGLVKKAFENRAADLASEQEA